MSIGVPKEIKDNENRIAIIPAGVQAFSQSGHQVLIQKSAGIRSEILDNVINILDANDISTNLNLKCKIINEQ